MNKFICIILSSIFLSGCFLRVHKMDIEQGNIIVQSQLDKLHTGMSSEQVRKIMGNPVMTNLFTPNRMSFVYTYQSGYQQMQAKRVECIFYNNRLVEILTSNS